MSNTTVNIRIDADLKKHFEQFCNDVGISMSAAFTMFAKQTVQQNKIPFEIKRVIPNKETLEAFEETEQILSDPKAYRSYANAEEMMKDILG